MSRPIATSGTESHCKDSIEREAAAEIFIRRGSFSSGLSIEAKNAHMSTLHRRPGFDTDFLLDREKWQFSCSSRVASFVFDTESHLR